MLEGSQELHQPASSFHGTEFLSVPTSQLSSALAFISRSTSAYMFVVARDTWPNQARIVLMSTPARSRCVAVVCRIVWGSHVSSPSKADGGHGRRVALHQRVDSETRQRLSRAG